MTRERFLEILEYLDGNGLIITDDDLIEESLDNINFERE